MIYTAEPETEDAERLALAIVLGTQALVDKVILPHRKPKSANAYNR
jgi:hypothetical protein